MLIVLPAVIGALVVGACADIEHPQCGRRPAGDQLARFEASPNDASGECRNVVATPMCADDSGVVSVAISNFLRNRDGLTPPVPVRDVMRREA
jgi:hypothetical protein